MLDLQKHYKDRKFLYILRPASLDVNILHNQGTLVKTNKLILVQY